MKTKILCVLFALILIISMTVIQAIPVTANTVSSSTIVFQATSAYQLTYNGDGTYTRVIPCVVDGGYDIFAKEGATAYFSEDPSVVIASHDAWPAWPVDTLDWYQYSLSLYSDGGIQKWAIRNHPGASEPSPWYDTAAPPMGVPMSGTMDWDTMYAMETDTGAYLPSTGISKYPGWAASNGGGAGYWDMDWTWGSEAVPLQYPGVSVSVSGSSSDSYVVTFTPAPAGTAYLTVDIPDIVAVSVDPTSIDYGSLIPGATSAEHVIKITNVGTHAVDVDASVSPTGRVFDNLQIAYNAVWNSGPDFIGIATGLAMNSYVNRTTRLPVPAGYTPMGPENAQLVFTVTSVP